MVVILGQGGSWKEIFGCLLIRGMLCLFECLKKWPYIGGGEGREKAELQN